MVVAMIQGTPSRPERGSAMASALGILAFTFMCFAGYTLALERLFHRLDERPGFAGRSRPPAAPSSGRIPPANGHRETESYVSPRHDRLHGGQTRNQGREPISMIYSRQTLASVAQASRFPNE